jgi:hypothetical protein
MLRRAFLRAGLALPILTRRAPGRSCILLNLTGGPSQLDTWDMKPDAPREIRGPFRPIRTNVPGISIAEIFPRMARHADKYALIRSVHHDVAVHEPALSLPGGRVIFSNDFGQALRFVESGERFVTVNMTHSWDAHGWKPFGSFSDYRDKVGPAFDNAYSSLLEGLEARGLLPSTLVVAMGEFGRSPRINPTGGRDHWPKCSTVLMAGGGVAGGQVYGSSDATSSEPRDNPVSRADIVATVATIAGRLSI